MIKKLITHWKLVIAIIIIPLSWVVFPFLTYGSNTILHFVPLFILLIQLVILILHNRKKLLILVLLNPPVTFFLVYTIKPAVNFIIGKPTIIKCTYYEPGTLPLDKTNCVFIEYFDDDCDFEGLYYYTRDINNFVTNGLIKLFGNPIKPFRKHAPIEENHKAAPPEKFYLF